MIFPSIETTKVILLAQNCIFKYNENFKKVDFVLLKLGRYYRNLSTTYGQGKINLSLEFFNNEFDELV